MWTSPNRAPGQADCADPTRTRSLSRAAAQIGSPSLRAAMERLARNEG